MDNKNQEQEQIFSLEWKSIPIEIIYKPNYANISREVMGYRLAHLQVISKNKTPIPLTETGYRSYFNDAKYIEAFGTPVDFVKAWLKEAEESKKWKTYLKKIREDRQLNLF